MPENKIKEISVAEAQTLCLARNIPFYSYRLPGRECSYFAAQIDGNPSPFRGFGSRPDKNGFALVPFSKGRGIFSWFIQEDLYFEEYTRDTTIIDTLYSIHNPAQNAETDNSDSDWPEYQREISIFISALRQNKLKKAVLSRSLTHTGANYRKAPELFAKMTKAYPDAFVFLVSIPGITTWTGATPEIFLRRKDSRITTMSLAGTQAAQNDPGNVIWEHKDREEQQIVSDSILRTLQEICNKDDISVHGPYTRQAGNVCHLCTDFACTVTSDGTGIDRLCDKLHPTPATGGFPKAEALELIRQTEKHDRRYYAGYLGPVRSNGDFDLFVNLRSMELFPDACRLYVGGGITALSDPQKEWEETEIKSHTLLNLL